MAQSTNSQALRLGLNFFWPVRVQRKFFYNYFDLRKFINYFFLQKKFTKLGLAIHNFYFYENTLIIKLYWSIAEEFQNVEWPRSSFSKLIETYLENRLIFLNKKLKIFVFITEKPNAKSLLTYLLSTRAQSLRVVKKKILFTSLNTSFSGVKIALNGRFSRKQRATRTVFNLGSMSYSTFQKKIEYDHGILKLRNGASSIKVWTWQNEKKNFKNFIQNLNTQVLVICIFNHKQKLHFVCGQLSMVHFLINKLKLGVK